MFYLEMATRLAIWIQFICKLQLKNEIVRDYVCDFDFQFNVFLNYSMLDQMSMFFHEEGQAGILSNADDGESTQNSFILPNNGG